MPSRKGEAGDGAGPALLQLRGVSRTYGERQALHPLDLDVAAGTCTALFGHNGSGKSTLLRIAGGRDEPTTGTALFDGRKIDEDDPEVRARVAVVGDTVACYPDLTVREHLELVTVAHAVDDADGWIDQVLADRRLADHARALPASLSSGQMQSLLLAAALVRPRDLLILDEPEQRLDPDRGEAAALLIGEKKDGVAVLLATHQADLAEAVADRMVALEDGEVVASGPPPPFWNSSASASERQGSRAGRRAAVPAGRGGRRRARGRRGERTRLDRRGGRPHSRDTALAARQTPRPPRQGTAIWPWSATRSSCSPAATAPRSSTASPGVSSTRPPTGTRARRSARRCPPAWWCWLWASS